MIELKDKLKSNAKQSAIVLSNRNLPNKIEVLHMLIINNKTQESVEVLEDIQVIVNQLKKDLNILNEIK